MLGVLEVVVSGHVSLLRFEGLTVMRLVVFQPSKPFS